MSRIFLPSCCLIVVVIIVIATSAAVSTDDNDCDDYDDDNDDKCLCDEEGGDDDDDAAAAAESTKALSLRKTTASAADTTCKIKTSLRYRNVVFEGGGMKGIAHIGALKGLAELGYYDTSSGRYTFDGVAGTSIGCIFALITALDIAPERLEKYVLEEIDFYALFDANSTYVIDNMPPRFESHHYFKFVDYIGYTYRLLSYTLRVFNIWRHDDVPGIDTGVHFLAWIRSRLFGLSPHAAALSRLDYNPTLEQLRAITGHSLTCFAARLVDTDIVRMSVDNTPHELVANVVYASCSLPMLFKPMYEESGYPLVDGGLFNNFPIYEYEHVEEGNATLGLSLHDSPIKLQQQTSCICRTQNQKKYVLSRHRVKFKKQQQRQRRKTCDRVKKNLNFVAKLIEAILRDRDYLHYTRDPRNCDRVIYLSPKLNTLKLDANREQIKRDIDVAEQQVRDFFTETPAKVARRLNHCARYATKKFKCK